MTYFIGSLKKCPEQSEYDNMTVFLISETAKAQRRVDALKRTKERDSNWQYLDQFSGVNVTIDDLIGGWESILSVLNDDRRELDSRMFAPKQGVLI
jgi:hypothetical protein